ncbi:MAG TPA: hypothetical protein VL358_08600 [Caulobacteraceae bacterium]|jgi:hypothetical protein|nr:hypothetical protein [Caulobacteraceae bacterium]
MFEWMVSTGLAHWVDESPWAYPFLLTVHGLGMAVVVGLTAMTGLRILGFPAKIPLGAYRGTLPWLVWAFIGNFLSGLVLFVHDAVALAGNVSFQVKVASLVVGVAVLWRMYSHVVIPAWRAETATGAVETEARPGVVIDGSGVVAWVIPRSGKALAVVAILIWWLSVIVSGRLVAYLAAAA